MKFLKENAEVVEESIREVFSGSADEKDQIKGRLVAYQYNEKDCSDFSSLVSGAEKSGDKKYMPGIQVVVKFPGFSKGQYYYPEEECSNIEDFIDNLNTDFGMAQVMHGRFQHLGISWYDLTSDVIRTGSPRLGNVQKMQGFSKCWNPETLEFSEDAFYALMGRKKPVSRGAENSDDGPQKMLGVDKKKFLAMVQGKQTQDDAVDIVATSIPSMRL